MVEFEVLGLHNSLTFGNKFRIMNFSSFPSNSIACKFHKTSIKNIGPYFTNVDNFTYVSKFIKDGLVKQSTLNFL
jgi:hypothetical protein